MDWSEQFAGYGLSRWGKKVESRLVQPYRQKQGVEGASQTSRKREERSSHTVVMSWRWPGELDCSCRAGVSNWTARGEGSSKMAFRQTRQWTQKLALCSLWWVFERAVEQVHLIKWYVWQSRRLFQMVWSRSRPLFYSFFFPFSVTFMQKQFAVCFMNEWCTVNVFTCLHVKMTLNPSLHIGKINMKCSFNLKYWSKIVFEATCGWCNDTNTWTQQCCSLKTAFQ